MTDVPSLEFRKLAVVDAELAVELAAAEPPDDPETESFGLSRLGQPLAGEGWGLWIKGSLSGAAWLTTNTPDSGEILALVLARGWRRVGLTAWMLDGLVAAAAAAGCVRVTAKVDRGGRNLGAELVEAGFTGPDDVAENYPIGDWSKPCRRKSS